MPAKRSPAEMDDPRRDAILERLRAFAKAASKEEALVKIPQFDDDIDTAYGIDESFAVRRVSELGPLHIVELEWKRSEALGSLQKDMFELLSWVCHWTCYVERIERDSSIEFNLITGHPEQNREPDTHIIQFKVVGAGVDDLLEWLRKERAISQAK